MNSIGIFVFIFTLLQVQIVRAQESNSTPTATSSNEAKEESKSSTNTKRDFESMHSFGYRPDQHKMDIEFTLQNTNSDFSVFLQSTGSSKPKKWYDSKATTSYLFTSLQYGFDDKSRIGLKLENVVSSNSKYTYTSEAKASGKSDYSLSSKGGKEPAIYIDRTLKETNDLRVYGFLSYSPKIGKSSDSNVLSGGSTTDLGFELIKAFEKTEFLFAVGYKIYGVRSYEEDNSKSETKDGNDLRFTVGLNFRTTQDSSFVALVNRNMSDFSTTQYENNPTLSETDSYAYTSYILGYQFSMSEDLLFQIGYAGFIVDEGVTRSGTQTIIIDPSTGGGITFGMKIAF